MAQQQALAGAQQSPGDVARAKGDTTEIELSRAEQAVARRTAESKATIPHLVLEAEIDMHECAALHERLAAGSPAVGAAIPSYEDMIVKACALALREHPRANSSYRDGRLQLHGRVNVGAALWVGAGSPSSAEPVTPTLFDADLKSLEQIARETRALAERARADALAPPELSGATFTVASLGAFPVKGFTAIINPPQVAILAVGAVESRPIAHDGTVLARHAMTATLACDGRALNGAEAAELLARIKQLLQEPAAIAL
ncbi:MAG TPA: 2-oxo acid dehydrogenase subunit E2 [Solirubrobacteraceae bacterium]|nr:2-oxo acid dehydrogenase subunit E2 [Solirubrobacteraceae bacterium]